MSEALAGHRQRYLKAMAAMTNGVAMKLSLDQQDSGTEALHDCHPVHLRTGINAAMVEHAALARLLMDKGIFNEEEYTGVLADEAELEQLRYERRLSVRLRGTPDEDVKLEVPAQAIA